MTIHFFLRVALEAAAGLVSSKLVQRSRARPRSGLFATGLAAAPFRARLGRAAQARAEFTSAAALTANASERAHLLRRAAACAPA